MHAIGIIAEYNPFHNGHLWHMETARRLTGCPNVIIVMSGNFVQRGEPAIFDKWKRAEMAVNAGADLVLELPFVFAVRSAQYFAAGAVRLLHSLGIVRHLCFGAEISDLPLLQRAAAVTAQAAASKELHYYLKQGYTYAAAIARAVGQTDMSLAKILAEPNNTLAVEYLKALQQFAPGITPLAVKRRYARHHDKTITAAIASATAIRSNILAHNRADGDAAAALPAGSAAAINQALSDKRGPVTYSAFSPIILSALRTASLDSLATLPDVAEGLHYKIQQSALAAANMDEFFDLLKSKRYTRTRLQRIAVHALLRTKNEVLQQFDSCGPLYARVLAFNQQGRQLLKEIASHSMVPLIIKTTKFLTSKERTVSTLTPLQHMLRFDTLATDLYVLGMPPSKWNRGGWDFWQSPLYIANNDRHCPASGEFAAELDE